MKHAFLCLLTLSFLTSPLGGQQSSQWIPLTSETVRIGWRFILPDPVSPSVLYANDGLDSDPFGLLISSDGGWTWRRVSFGRQTVQGAAVTQEAVPTLYVRTSSTDRKYLQRSRDGGAIWTEMEIESPLSGIPSSLAADGQNGDVVYVGLDRCLGSCKGGVIRSLNGGRDWTATALQNKVILTLTTDPSIAGVVYATSSEDAGPGLYRSVNSGVTWTKLPLVSQDQWLPLQFDRSASSTIFTVVRQGNELKLMRSNDRGDQWTTIYSATTFAARHALAVDPRNAARIAYSFGSTALITNDGGATWSDISRGLTSPVRDPAELLFTADGRLYARAYLGIMTFTERLPRRRSVRH